MNFITGAKSEGKVTRSYVILHQTASRMKHFPGPLSGPRTPRRNGFALAMTPITASQMGLTNVFELPTGLLYKYHTVVAMDRLIRIYMLDSSLLEDNTQYRKQSYLTHSLLRFLKFNDSHRLGFLFLLNEVRLDVNLLNWVRVESMELLHGTVTADEKRLLRNSQHCFTSLLSTKANCIPGKFTLAYEYSLSICLFDFLVIYF